LDEAMRVDWDSQRAGLLWTPLGWRRKGNCWRTQLTIRDLMQGALTVAGMLRVRINPTRRKSSGVFFLHHLLLLLAFLAYVQFQVE